MSPTGPVWAPQSHHEPILLAHLQAAPSATVQFGIQVLTLDDIGDRVRVAGLDVASGEEWQIEARRVVAADGAHSVVRREMAVAMEGPDDLEAYERVEFACALPPGDVPRPPQRVRGAPSAGRG